MSIPPADRVPPVRITFRTPDNPLYPIHHVKTPQLDRPTADSVNFPFGHANFSPEPSEAIITSAFKSFVSALTEVLAEPTIEAVEQPQEEAPTTTATTKIPPKAIEPLKEAFEALQAQIQEGIELFPEKQPLPKALLQVFMQTPVFVEELQQLLKKTPQERPVMEDAELPIEFPEPPLEIPKKALEELQRNIPIFVKTLQTALQELPQAVPLKVKEALEEYLKEPSVQKVVPEIAREIPSNEPKSIVLERPPLLPELPPSLIEKPTISPPKPELAEKPEVLPKAMSLPTEEEKIPPPKAPVPEKAPEILPEKEVTLPARPLSEEPPLTRLPLIALREALESAYPLLKNLLVLLEKEPIPPKELIAVLEKIPFLVGELATLIAKKPGMISPEERNLFERLEKEVPALFETIRTLLSQPFRPLPPKVQQALEEYLNLFPEETLLALSKTKSPLPKPASSFEPEIALAPEKEELAPMTQKRAIQPPVLEKPVIEPLVILPEMERIYPEEFAAEGLGKDEKQAAIGKVYPYFVSREEREAAQGRIDQAREPRERLPVIPIELFKEIEKVPPRQPEFSTEIPFAFIVPYIALNPINFAPLSEGTPPTEFRKENRPDSTGIKKKKSLQVLTYIPKGEAFIDEPRKKGNLHSFAIGIYLVTNEQFADFLTQQSMEKKIYMGDRGQIFSKKNNLLLCQIRTGTEQSDIEAEPQKEYLLFHPSPEKEAYPVVCVTYHGAKAFCDAGGFRLPTEPEWEKAASLDMTEDQKVRKEYTYGCSEDEISNSLANYNAKSSGPEVLTTPVGFYNGKTTLTREGELIETIDAKSPFGCYDMSGNVWEWTDAGESGYKIVKGGCFLSVEEDLQVRNKVRKRENSLDGCTGFRVALSG